MFVLTIPNGLGIMFLGMDKITFSAAESVTVEFYVANDDTLQDKKIFLPHLHDKTEIYILLDGSSSFVVGDETVSLSPYDALVIPPYTLHHCILPKPTKHNHACFWINGSFDAFNEVLKNDNFPLYVPDDKSGELKTVCEYFDENFDESDKLGVFKRVCDLLYYLKNAAKIKPVSKPENDEILLPALAKILADVKENSAEISGTKDIAERNFISVSTLTRLFEKHLNITPKEYLDYQKLSMAKIYLGNGCNVKEACEKAGFPNCSNFIRLFKDKFSITPNKYRKAYKSD